ncbi:PA2169 family four-helix-bundle protein [uncultured Nonlabens sp.]|uniref:ferritin-like domain-containing protein n=1 Tax=uncultured Nonlabens sp. TaxID=859306 RepID=UPI0030DB64AB|tara:strand:- start:126492 stop:126938 length:447 start_codon:yes stop_codon:yes gene_type:complete
MKYTKEVSEKLNDLLTKNYDAEAGYKLAKDKVNSSRIKDFFTDQAQERYNFGHELKEEIRNYGESPDKGTSLKGDAHRTWMKFKSAFSTNNEEAILEEAIRGEKTALEEYNSIISETAFPPSTKNMLTSHRNTILNSLSRVTAMEEIA